MTAPLRKPQALTVKGAITSVQGSSIVATFPQAAVGDVCWLSDRQGRTVRGQVVAFAGSDFSVALFEEPEGIYPGIPIFTNSSPLMIPAGCGLLGRVISPLGDALDGAGIPPCHTRRPLMGRPPPVSERPLIEEALETGVRAIDGFCTLGTGQRIGIFASAGIGKSTLLSMIARRASADVIVVALVGERGREVKEFLDESLGPEGLARSVVVVATSDDSSLMRQTAPYAATAIAEHFRDMGKRVLLIVDSLTRMARAVRETSLAAGDLPVRHGYTNSVYTQLPKLLERAGRSSRGSITALYTVLTNQEDDIDPLADEAKSLLDGHISLRHEIATLGVLPAIDITQSISRLFSRLSPHGHIQVARRLAHAMTRLLRERHVALLGGVPDPELARILDNQEALLGCVRQELSEECGMEITRQRMEAACRLLAGL